MKTKESIEQLLEQREGMTNTMLDMLACISAERENVKKLAEAYEAALAALRPNTHKNNSNTKGNEHEHDKETTT